MQFNLIFVALSEWAPLAVVAFAVLLVVFAEVSRWLRERQRRSPRRVWIELIAQAIAPWPC